MRAFNNIIHIFSVSVIRSMSNVYREIQNIKKTVYNKCFFEYEINFHSNKQVYSVSLRHIILFEGQ